MAFVEVEPDVRSEDTSRYFKFNTGENKALTGEFLYTGIDGYGKTSYVVLTKQGIREFTPLTMLKQLMVKATESGLLVPGRQIAAMVTGEKQMNGEGDDGTPKKAMLLFRFRVDPDSKMTPEGAAAIKAKNGTSAPQSQGNDDNIW